MSAHIERVVAVAASRSQREDLRTLVGSMDLCNGRMRVSIREPFWSRAPQLTWKFASVSSCSRTSFMVSSTSTRNLRDLLEVSSSQGVSSACSSPRRVNSRTHRATCDDCEYPGLAHRCCAGAEWSEIPQSVSSMISSRSDRKAPRASKGSMRDAQH